MSISRLKGKKAEDVACNFLLKNGLSLVTRNYHCKYGEIDLIMHDDDTLVFVEVRYRKSNLFGSDYLQSHSSHLATRFDVIAMSEHQQIEWISNAFMEN